MRKDILKNLQQEIYDRCQKETNKFGMGCYYHIVAVVKNAEILAEEYGADKEIVMIAAWLHDIASITEYSLYELHHIHGAEMAYSILKEYGYDDRKISLVQNVSEITEAVSVRKNTLKNYVLPTPMQSHTLTVCRVFYI